MSTRLTTVPAAIGALFAVGLFTATSAAAQAPVSQSSDLRALHLRMPGEDFVSVEPVGEDVRIRVVHVGRVNDWCPGFVVQAVEKTLLRTTVQRVAGLRVCTMTNDRVESALTRAEAHRVRMHFYASVDAVVADCPNAEREFVFVVPPDVDRVTLEQQSPDVEALWNLGARMRAVAMGNEPFENAAPETQAAREALGSALVPVLLDGKYSPYLAPLLADYTGPPEEREPNWVEVIDLPSLNLENYVAPVMPPIALSARVYGDVRLKVTAEAATGRVTQVDVLRGPPLLFPSAVKAIRAWRFAPGATPADPIEVTVRYRLQCP